MGAPGPGEEDVVVSIVRLVPALVPLDPPTQQALDRAIRHQYGGDEVYIRRASWQSIAERNAAILAALAAGTSVSEAARTYCVSQAWVKRLRARSAATPTLKSSRHRG
mgnify:FL=1